MLTLTRGSQTATLLPGRADLAGLGAFDLGSLIYLPQAAQNAPWGSPRPQVTPGPPDRLGVAPGTIQWPCGASRIALGQFLCLDTQVAVLREMVGETPKTSTLTLNLGGVQFQHLSLLHVLPLAVDRQRVKPGRVTRAMPDGQAADALGISLVLLVDARYYFQTTPPDWVFPPTDWATADANLSSWVTVNFPGRTLTADTVASGLMKPGEALGNPSLASTALGTRGYQGHAGILIDGIAQASGRRFVVTRDGNFLLQNMTTARASDSVSREAFAPERQSGGLISQSPESEADQPSCLVPTKMLFVFPKKSGTTEVAPYTKEVTFDAVRANAGMPAVADGAGTVPLREGTLVVSSSAWSDGTNAAVLDAHATAWATAWYAWLSGQELIRYSGLVAYDPSGLADQVRWGIFPTEAGYTATTEVSRGLLNPRPDAIHSDSGVTAPLAGLSTFVRNAVSYTPSGIALPPDVYAAFDKLVFANTTGLVAERWTYEAPVPPNAYLLKLLPATPTQGGGVTITDQAWQGKKDFYGPIVSRSGVWFRSPVGGSPDDVAIGQITGLVAGWRRDLTMDSGTARLLLMGDDGATPTAGGYVVCQLTGPNTGFPVGTIPTIPEFAIGMFNAAGSFKVYHGITQGTFWHGGLLATDLPGSLTLATGTDSVGGQYVDGLCTVLATGGGGGGGVTSLNGMVGAINIAVTVPLTIVSGGGSITLGYSGGSGSGTVTSVGLTAPASTFTVANSPITTAGNIDLGFATQNAHYALWGPTSGSPAVPTWRAPVADDISPNLLPLSKLTQASANNHFVMRTTAGSGDWQDGSGAQAALAVAPSLPTSAASLISIGGGTPPWGADGTYVGMSTAIFILLPPSTTWVVFISASVYAAYSTASTGPAMYMRLRDHQLGTDAIGGLTIMLIPYPNAYHSGSMAWKAEISNTLGTDKSLELQFMRQGASAWIGAGVSVAQVVGTRKL